MKKVVYSVTRSGKSDFTKITGIGYITDKDLFESLIKLHYSQTIALGYLFGTGFESLIKLHYSQT